MDSRSWTRLVAGVCLGVSLAALLCLIVYKIRLVLVPFGAGFVVAYIFDPWLDRLESRGWSRQRAVWTVMVLVVAILALLLIVLVPRVIQETGDAWENRELYAARVDRIYKSTRSTAESWLEPYLPDTNVGEYLDRQMREGQGWADKHKGQVLGWLGGRTLQALGMLFLVLFGALVAFHFMMVIDPLRQGAAALVLSPQQSQDVDAIVARVNRMLGSYVRGLVAVSALAGVVTGLALWGVGLYFGTRYALIIGLLAGVTYAVPWLGQTVSAGAALLAGLATADHHSILAGLVSAGLVVAINQISDNLVMPRIVGRQVGLHPLAVLFALMAGFQLWGLVGLIVAVPIAAAIRIALHRWVPTLPEDEEEETRRLPRLDLVRLGRSIGEGLRRFVGAAANQPEAAKDQTQARAEPRATEQSGDS